MEKPNQEFTTYATVTVIGGVMSQKLMILYMHNMLHIYAARRRKP
jgi:hypothetical protein